MFYVSVPLVSSDPYMVVLSVALMWRFFFFKQKTAYEMRISDWSSDVCSSDLVQPSEAGVEPGAAGNHGGIAAGEPGLRLRIGREQGGSGVALAQILGQGAFDISGNLGGGGWCETGRGGHSVSVGAVSPAGASSPAWLSLPTIAVIARSNSALAASTRALPSANRPASSRGA